MLLQSKNLFKGLIYIFISLVIFPSQSTESDSECGIIYTEEPPFWVVTGDTSMENRTYENFKSPKTHNGNYQKISSSNASTIAKAAIVVQDPNRPIIYQSSAINSSRYLPVIVARTPKEEIDQIKTAIVKKYHSISSFIPENGRMFTQNKPFYKDSKKHAQVWDKGYIYGGSLRSVNGENVIIDPSIIPPGTLNKRIVNGSTKSDFIFVVEKDSPFFSIPGVENLDSSYALTLRTNNKGEYQSFKPCPDENNPDKDLTPSYFFDLSKVDIDGNKEREQTIIFRPQDKCDQLALSSLIPVEEDKYLQFLSLTKSLNTEEEKSKSFAELITVSLDDMLLVQIPQGDMFRIGNGQCFTRGPFGSVHYTGLYNCDAKSTYIEQNGDSLLEYNSACALTGALKSFQEKCPGCIAQWGDAYLPVGIHKSHVSGHCIDFRPVQDEGELGPGRYVSQRKKYYNFENTVKLVEAMMEAGADQIIFNDYSIRGKIDENVRSFTRYNTDKELNIRYKNGGPVHEDHLHICFPTQKELNSGDNEKFRAEQEKRMKASCRYAREE